LIFDEKNVSKPKNKNEDKLIEIRLLPLEKEVEE
jgi:hypothetical protein